MSRYTIQPCSFLLCAFRNYDWMLVDECKETAHPLNSSDLGDAVQEAREWTGWEGPITVHASNEGGA
jgi:hypothetical protein